MDQNALDVICQRIDASDEEIIAIERALTALPALAPENGGEGEAKKAAWIQAYLREQLGCGSIQNFDAPDERVPGGKRPNFVAVFPGKHASRTLWIMSHMDVVPPGDLSQWHGDPWTVRVEDGRIYGRGTEDNQQGIASSLITARAFVEAKVQPEANLGLMFVSDEETGSKYGVQYVLSQHRDLFKPDDYIIIPDAGNAEGTLIEIAEKTIVWFRFQVVGKQTHGSTPDKGVNALKAAANLIVKLNNLYMIYNTLDPVFDPPNSTFEPTRIEPNVPNINTIPGEVVFYLDCRLLPNYDVDQFRRNVERICSEIETRYKVKITIGVEQELRAAPPTQPDAPVVLALEKAIADIAHVQAKPMGIGGGTVAAFFRNLGLDTVVWATQDETLHGPDEYARIDYIKKDAKVFAHMALQ